MIVTDICVCGHGIERHSPTEYGDYCAGRPPENHPFGDRPIGPMGDCPCRGFRPVQPKGNES